MKFLKLMRVPAALLMALFMLFSVFGCSVDDINDGLSLAGDIIGLIDEIGSENTVTFDADETAGVLTEKITEEITETLVEEITEAQTEAAIAEDGYYYSRDEVALYLNTYKKLPENFITKSKAEDLGWSGGSVERFLDGAAIGGDRFGNREGILPKKDGRVYYECDIDTNGKSSRGAKRIVYSNDGLIYYTDDHYESFVCLYGEE